MDEFDKARDLGLIGLGLLAVSTSKLVSKVDEMIAKNQVNKKEGEKMIKMLKQEGFDRRREVENLVKNELKDFYKSVFVSKKDFESLEKRILKLEKTSKKKK
jgi:polyhydroxyalkanoate synthesis regulator phasin